MKVMTIQDGLEFCEATHAETEFAFLNFAPLCEATETNLDFVRQEFANKNCEALTIKQDGKPIAVVFVKVIFGQRLEALAGAAIDNTKFHIQKILDGLVEIAKAKNCKMVSLSTRRKVLATIFEQRGYKFAGVNFVLNF